MLKRFLIIGSLLLITNSAFPQFHTLKIPQRSNQVIESQRLAVTDITINYSSPSVNNRDVWNDTNVIPQSGNPIPWRAGANMNTTIAFNTNVKIEGKTLEAGTYGLHVIPKGDTYTLLFAHNSNQWGSYYLDIEKDVSLSIDVKAEPCAFSEKMDFEFLDWTKNSVKIGLEWAEKRIPFNVSIDLNETVLASFRDELRGINTYHWQAWDDAANWCLNQNTNLEEALEWANRSINGGYNGFASNENFTNTSTKLKLLKKLNRTEEANKTVQRLALLDYKDYEAYDLSRYFLENESFVEAKAIATAANKKHPKVWFLLLNESIADYFLGNSQQAIKSINKFKSLVPEGYQSRIEEIIGEMKAKTYGLPK
ncbi:DUF2911 domain-containing protein [uncultured Psychroserpens sp.]|uniref:DUF2911 domain-containing protein n=1 Tax=uncultured Psychroserpens sp. TaxID=255436 RepID=UPI002621D05A|nr:DUF2911 domain-containing protein [uncultured Psychroserpens sp.]